MTQAEGRVRSLERMLETRPGDARIRFALAVEYLNQGRLEDGIGALQGYLAVSDDEGNAWARLGRALEQVGRPDEAAAAYRRGIEAADAHGHPTLAEDLSEALRALEE